MSSHLATAPLSTKVTDDEKRAFVELCHAIGTSPSNALRMFVTAFNRRRGFPFDVSNPEGFNAETLQAMDDAINHRNLAGPFDTNEEMWASIFDGED